MLTDLALGKIPPSDESLRVPLRTIVDKYVSGLSAYERSRSWMGFDSELSRALGDAGFLGLTLPKKYGGQGRSALARFVVVEELLSVGAPVAAHWIADRQSSQLILNFGSEAQKEFYLPPICRGESYFCIGMSEPDAGSDLASVRTRAERTDQGWQLNGQKLWTTNALHSHYMIALVRTSGSPADRHQGCSQFIIDLKTPGISIRSITDLTGDAHFAEVFFDNVCLPADALIGQEGAGWEQVTAELAFERSGPERIYSSIVLLDTWIEHIRKRGEISDNTIMLIGQLSAELAVLREMSLAVTTMIVSGKSPALEASLVKDIGTSFEQSVPTIIADDLGRYPFERVSTDLRHALFYMLQVSPSFSLRGGTREILRGIIARGLGLR